MNLKVIRKDGTIEDYKEQKIINAVNKAAYRVLTKFTDEEYSQILNRVFELINEEDLEDEKIRVEDLHIIVENALE